MERQYRVVIYDLITELEDYEYFDSKKDSINYAKKIKCDSNNIVVQEIKYYCEDDYEEIEDILEL